jgi:DNA invertase Pin-like site-specific DNA recombinase
MIPAVNYREPTPHPGNFPEKACFIHDKPRKNIRLTASQLLSHYCTRLYQQLGTYKAVARLTELDRRTVKKYINTPFP